MSRRPALLVTLLITSLALAACTPPGEASDAPRVALADSPPGDAVAIPEGSIDAAVDALPGIVERVRDQMEIPGIAVAVVHGGRTVYAEGFGVRRLGADDPVDPQTVFQIASMSKPIGASVVASQVAAGVIAWDTPVAPLLPGFALADPWVSEHVSVGDLYAHRSGLPKAAGDDLEDLGYDRAYVLSHLTYLPLDPFRSSYNYANFGMTAGAEAVAVAAGTDWADLSERALYEPLGMSSTSSRHEDFLAAQNRASLHARIDGEWRPAFDRDPDEQSPAGGVSSSVLDVARWMAFVLGRGTVDGQEVVPADALAPAMAPHAITEAVEDPALRTPSYGYGFGVGVDATGRVVLSHSGAFLLGAATTVRLVPDLDLGITVLTNAAPVGAPEAIAAEFLDLVEFGAATRDWMAGWGRIAALLEPTGDLAGADVPTDPAPSAELEQYVGDYANPYFGTASVVLDGARLVVRLGPDGGYELSLAHRDGDTFAAEPTGENAPDGSVTSVVFTRDAQGPAATMRIAFFDGHGLGSWVR